jgi:hypothetical protein
MVPFFPAEYVILPLLNDELLVDNLHKVNFSFRLFLLLLNASLLGSIFLELS